QVTPDRESSFDAALHHEISTQWTRLEIAILEIGSVGIAGRDIGPAETGDVGAVVGLQHTYWNREHARPELVLAEAAHRVRSAGVKSFSRMEHTVANRRGASHCMRCDDKL